MWVWQGKQPRFGRHSPKWPDGAVCRSEFARGMMKEKDSDRKRARRPWGQEEEDSDDSDAEGKARGNEAGNRAKKARPMGADYKAKKAAGDVKLAGKAAPYAYLQFDRKSLNKRCVRPRVRARGRGPCLLFLRVRVRVC